MKQIKDASHIFVPDIKREQTIKFISFDKIRDFRNHFLINNVFQEAVFSKPTKFFRGEAEYFLLQPILALVDQMMLTGKQVQTKNPFNDESVANTFMKIAQNAANYSALLDIQKSSYYAGRQFSEAILKDRILADWNLENTLLNKAGERVDASTTSNAEIDWMKTLFGSQVSKKQISPIEAVDITAWPVFANMATTVLGLGPGLYTEQRNIAPFIADRSRVENFFYGVNFPGFVHLPDASDAVYILALMYLDYCHVTSTPEMYQTVMRPEAPNTPQRLDAMATRARRFMKYYAAMAIAPRFMSMYTKYLLMKDLNEILKTWTDNELSASKDMQHKMTVIEGLCKAIVPERFLRHTEDILRWFKDFYGVAYLLPDEYSSLADFAGLKSINPDQYLVKVGDPIVQSVVYKDKVLTQKTLVTLCSSRDAYIDLMYHACLSLDTHIQQIDKSVSTIQAWDEFTSFELPTIPRATEFGQVKFAVPHMPNIINDSIPKNAIEYVYIGDELKPSRSYLGNVDVVPALKSLVFGTIKPNVWLASLRSSKKSTRPAEGYNPSDVRMIFTNEHTLYIGSRPMAHYAEMPIPVDYLAYADPSCVDPTIAGLLSVIQTLPSPYKVLSDYFSVAAAQFDIQYNYSDLTSAFASVGFWFKGGLTAQNKRDDFDSNWLMPSTNFIYGVHTAVFYKKQMQDLSKPELWNNRYIIVRSAASDAEYTFVMHKYFPMLSEVFQHAQTFCDGFVADIPVLGTYLLKSILGKSKVYDKIKFQDIVVEGLENGLLPEDYSWFVLTGWSKHTAILPHMTFRVSSQSSALSDKIIGDPDIMKRFAIIAHANDKEIRPVSRAIFTTPLVYIEPEDVMLSHDSTISLVKPKIADLTDSLSKRAEMAAESMRTPGLSPNDIEPPKGNARADALKPGHDEGLKPAEVKGDIITAADARDAKSLEQATASDQTGFQLVEGEKKAVTEQSRKTGDIVTEPVSKGSGSGATENAQTNIPEKKKKKIKRIKPSGDVEVIEVEADYKLGEGEEFIE